MNNKDLLNEGFFKKKSYADELAKKYPQYAPMDAKNTSEVGFTAVDSTNTAELKKRLTGAFGAAIGNNTVKSMASKAIKRFPIIISENVDPQTAVLLKNYLEVQYAEYLNLLISNQIIDLTQFDRNDPNGYNIAIQALDQITGTEFGRQRIANKAMKGSLSPDDVFANNVIYSLIRQESVQTSDDNVNAILEDAIVIDSKKANELVSMLTEECIREAHLFDAEVKSLEKDIAALQGQIDGLNANAKTPEEKAKIKPQLELLQHKIDMAKSKIEKYKSADMLIDKSQEKDIDALIQSHPQISSIEINKDPLRTQAIAHSQYITDRVAIEKAKDKDYRDDLRLRGLAGVDGEGFEHYDRLTNTEIVVDPQLLSASINKSVGEILSDPRNDFLKNRFEKATFLLQSRIIAGSEYFAYVTQRLGLPIRDAVRRTLITKFPAKELASPEVLKGEGGTISIHAANLISKNQREVYKISTSIMQCRASDVLKMGAVGSGLGGGLALGTIAIVNAWNPIGWIAAGGAAAAGGIAGAIAALFKNRKNKHGLVKRTETYEGWQRVEELIEAMDDRTYQLRVEGLVHMMKNDRDNIRADAIAIYNKNNIKTLDPTAEIRNVVDEMVPMQSRVDEFTRNLNKLYESCSIENSVGCDLEAPIRFNEEAQKFNRELCEAVSAVYGITPEALIERVTKISMDRPVSLTSISYDDKSDLVVPSFGTKNVMAYGSVEYDRREIKDRKFNTPLIMTVKFKERYSDGKYADNELTAVIGILGVITRVPSEEMEFILKANTQGATLKGIFSSDAKTSLADLFANFKANNDASKMPVSGELWGNMEKLGQLAVANKLAGKATNNIANAHIIFSQKELDTVRQTTGVDYLRDRKATAALMKRYSAMNIMVANDSLERVMVFDSIDSINWDVVPYDALRGKDTSDQLSAALSKLR